MIDRSVQHPVHWVVADLLVILGLYILYVNNHDT